MSEGELKARVLLLEKTTRELIARIEALEAAQKQQPWEPFVKGRDIHWTYNGPPVPARFDNTQNLETK